MSREWRAEQDGTLAFHFEVPEGTKAHLKLPYHPENVRKELSGGSYDFSYLSTKDFAHRFADDSIVKDITNDPEAMEIVAKVSGPLSFMMQSADKEMASEQFVEEMSYDT